MTALTAIERVVIVGAGAAGLTALEVLREEGFNGHVTLLGAEPHLPYDRPPLSKNFLHDTQGVSDLMLRPAASFPDLAADVVLADPAVRLDRRQSTVVTASGQAHRYDKLIIATGVDARRLDARDPERRIRYLRTVDDATHLRERLSAQPRVVVIGAGFLGVEFAVTARALGCDVTVIDPETIPMRRQFGEFVGRRIQRHHERSGVVFRLGVGVDQVTGPRPDRTSLRLGDGTRLEADLVLGAVGSQPAHGWLGGSDLMHAAGVPVDQRCQAGEHIYVAGDLAAQAVGGGSGGYRRVEHRLNASEQGRCAAQNLLDRGSKLASSGYFWSDQGDLRLQAVGTISNASRFEVVSGDPEGDRFVLVSIADHTIEAVMAWNDARGLTRWRRQVGETAEDALPRAVQ